MSLHIDLLCQRSSAHVAISIRRRWPVAYADEAAAVAAGIKLLHAHPEMVGFVIVPPGLDGSNAAALHERTITRAIAARKAKGFCKLCGGRGRG